jgi:hypothetical protein
MNFVAPANALCSKVLKFHWRALPRWSPVSGLPRKSTHDSLIASGQIANHPMVEIATMGIPKDIQDVALNDKLRDTYRISHREISSCFHLERFKIVLRD